MALYGKQVGSRPTLPSPAAASPTAGIDPRTLEQLLGLFKQSMGQPHAPRQLPPMNRARRVPQLSAFQQMQQARRV